MIQCIIWCIFRLLNVSFGLGFRNKPDRYGPKMNSPIERQRWFPSNYLHSYPAFIIRLALIWPLNFYRNGTRLHWELVKDNDELRSAAFGTTIAATEKIAAKWGLIAFCYNIIAWIPFTVTVAPLHVIFNVMDILIAVYLLKAVQKQGSYTTLDLKRCGDLQSWQLPQGATETFYDTMARLTRAEGEPSEICEAFSLERRYGIAIVVLHFTLAAIGILVAINAVIRNHRKGIPQYLSLYLTFYPTSVWPPILRPLLLTTLGLAIMACVIAYGFPVGIVRAYTPWVLIHRRRFLVRYAIKAMLCVKERAAKRLRIYALKKKTKTKQMTISEGDDKPTPLTEFLGVYDVLVMVFQHLHYTDVMKLRATSKSMRRIVLPTLDPQRIQHIKRYTCNEGTKSECYVCTNTICGGCYHSLPIPQTELYWHLNNCVLYCTDCFRQDVLSRLPINKKNEQDKHGPQDCNCPPPPERPNVWNLNVDGEGFYRRRMGQLRSDFKDVCKDCICLTVEEVLKRREARTRAELKTKDLKKIGPQREVCRKQNCGQEIGNGPRWWVCVRCKWECKCLVHRPWGCREDEEAPKKESV